MPVLSRAPTPQQWADSWRTEARRNLEVAARRGRIDATHAASVPVYGDNVVNYLAAKGQQSVSLNKFLGAAHRYALRDGERVAGDSNRISLEKALNLAPDLVEDYFVLRGRAPAEGASTTLRGTWWLDLDAGVQSDVGDIWWEHLDESTRYLTPGEGVSMRRLGQVDFDSVTFEQLSDLSYSTRSINGSDSRNRLGNGTVVAIQTDEGRFAKLLIEDFGYDLRVRFVTYDHDGTALSITPSTLDPTPPVDPPVRPPVDPPLPSIVRPVAALTARPLPRGVAGPTADASAAELGFSTWVASRFDIDPARLQEIDADPRLVDALAYELAYPDGNDHAFDASTEVVTRDAAVDALGQRIIGWEDLDEPGRDAIRAGARPIIDRLLPEAWTSDPNVRLRAMAFGDEDNTINVAGLVAWKLDTGEVRGLFAHHIW